MGEIERPTVPKAQPWSPADATDEIRRLADSEKTTFVYTTHAKEQMIDRDLIVGDVLYVMRNGFVYEVPEASTRNDLYKYKIESATPNSGNRKSEQ